MWGSGNWRGAGALWWDVPLLDQVFCQFLSSAFLHHNGSVNLVSNRSGLRVPIFQRLSSPEEK